MPLGVAKMFEAMDPGDKVSILRGKAVALGDKLTS
jgi:hypothetical protein